MNYLVLTSFFVFVFGLSCHFQQIFLSYQDGLITLLQARLLSY